MGMATEGTCGGNMKAVGEGTCGGASYLKRYKGNKYRASNDDGSTQSRKRAGSPSRKHTSPHVR